MDDKNNVILHILSNKSRFRFSSKHNNEKLNELFVEARVLYKTIIDLPILPNLASQIEGEIIKRSIFGTAALEGNPLKEEEVNILYQKEQKQTKIIAEQEIYNLKNTYALIDKLVIENTENEISLQTINIIHKNITFGIDYDQNIPGKFRRVPVKVGDKDHGGIYTPPKISKDIDYLMKELVKWLNSSQCKKLNPIIRAALAHYHIGIIHPFGQGNGRTARAVEAFLLRSANIKYVPLMLSNYYYQNIDDYYWAYSNTLKNLKFEITPFLEFLLTGFVEALHEIKDRITYFIRKFTLRDYYTYLFGQKEISKRQFELLNTLLSSNHKFRAKDLTTLAPYISIFRGVTDRTIKRDVKNLIDKKIIVNIDSIFELNWRRLG